MCCLNPIPGVPPKSKLEGDGGGVCAVDCHSVTNRSIEHCQLWVMVSRGRAAGQSGQVDIECTLEVLEERNMKKLGGIAYHSLAWHCACLEKCSTPAITCYDAHHVFQGGFSSTPWNNK